MCFSPEVSIATAFIEFCIALYLLFCFRRSKIVRFMALFVFLLGFYQFTEFMMCVTLSAKFWALVGFITYTFLPALALGYSSRIPRLVIYAPAIIMTAIAVFTEDFIIQAGCSTLFVSVRTLLWLKTPLLTIFYTVYYFGFIILACYILVRSSVTRFERRMNYFIVLAVALATIPAFVLIGLFPSLGVMSASVYCEFALVIAIMALYVAYLDSRLS